LRRLIIRPGAIGDFILSLPAMEFLRSGYTEVWAASANLPLARFADRTRSIAATGLDLLGLDGVEPPASLLQALHGFDSIISWYGSNRPEFRQAALRLGLPVEFHRAIPDGAAGIHAADFYLRQVGGQGTAMPRLDPAPRGAGCVFIHPFSGSPRKDWPIDRYRELARRLAGRHSVRWVVEPGGKSVDGVELEPPTGDLFELARRLAGARLYVGNDSGITHLAAASGAPVVALFGPSDPAVWAPRARRLRIVSSGGLPLESIPVETVLAAAQSLPG
jgi:hypothetical protein